MLLDNNLVQTLCYYKIENNKLNFPAHLSIARYERKSTLHDFKSTVLLMLMEFPRNQYHIQWYNSAICDWS